MLKVATPQDMKNQIGKELGVSEWVTVDQDMINKFADATGDHQWIHIDEEKAAAEMPNGKTIAHGFLTLSLLPMLMSQIYKVEKSSRGINYGANKVRFTNMVPSGSKVRARQKVDNVEDIKGDGVRVYSTVTVEIEGQERPALVAETIMLSYA